MCAIKMKLTIEVSKNNKLLNNMIVLLGCIYNPLQNKTFAKKIRNATCYNKSIDKNLISHPHFGFGCLKLFKDFIHCPTKQKYHTSIIAWKNKHILNINMFFKSYLVSMNSLGSSSSSSLPKPEEQISCSTRVSTITRKYAHTVSSHVSHTGNNCTTNSTYLTKCIQINKKIK